MSVCCAVAREGLDHAWLLLCILQLPYGIVVNSFLTCAKVFMDAAVV